MTDFAATLVIADASPLIGLAAARRFELLRCLYRSVTVTRAVLDEVVAGGGGKPGAHELQHALRSGWIRAAPTPMETWAFPELGAGEASSIALALKHPGALVLLDDVPGRERAAASGVATLGLADVLLEAKRAGLVSNIRPDLERLTRKGFVLPVETARALLAEAGEV